MEPQSQTPYVSIIIPTKNAGGNIAAVLSVIFAQETLYIFEVLIIDSGSCDITLDIIKRYAVRLFSIKPAEFNHGLTRNFGITQAKGEFVILMTQDALPAGNKWMDNLIRNFLDDEKVAGVYARQIPRDDADALTKRNLNNWITAGPKREAYKVVDVESFQALTSMQRYIVSYFDDVCSCLRKSVWKNIPYEKTYFGEDVEWGKKVILSGYKIVYEPSSAVIHSHRRSARYEYKRTYLCHRRLHELFSLRTVPNLRYVVLFTIKNIINDVLYALRYERGAFRKLAQLLRIPFFSFAGVFAQYKGAKDQMRVQESKVYLNKK